jgi:hypothetical protein
VGDRRGSPAAILARVAAAQTDLVDVFSARIARVADSGEMPED